MAEEYVKKEHVDVSWAEKALSTQVINRVLRSRQVRKYANAMKRGQWTDSNNPICFDTDGHLVDGQHRLHAVIESGIPIDTLVLYNFPKEAVENIDQGSSRSCADSLKISGDLDPTICDKRVIAVARNYLKIALTGSGFDYECLTNDDIKDFLIKYGKECSLAVSISRKGAGHALMDRSASGTAVFAAIISGENIDKLYRFAECVNSGIYDGESERASLVCRNYLQAIKKFGGNQIEAATSVTEQAIADFVIGKSRRNAYREDKHPYIKKIDLSKGGD